MSAFGKGVRARREAARLSLRDAAQRAHIHYGYLSKIENGKAGAVSGEIATALDVALDAGGALSRLNQSRGQAGPAEPFAILTPVQPADHPLGETDVHSLYATIKQLISLDRTWGGNGLHPTGVLAFRTAQQKLAAGAFERAYEADLQRAVAELAEVCGWLLYDADQQDDARRMFTEAIIASENAGDFHMEMFCRDLMAMQALHMRRPQEALAIATRALGDARIHGRAAAIFHLRRGRALADLGIAGDALDALSKSRSDLAEGMNASDAPWTWWIHEAEVNLHEARALTALGLHSDAVDHAGVAEEMLPGAQVRDWSVYRAYRIDDLTAAGAWDEAEHAILELAPRYAEVSSTRVANLVKSAIGRRGVPDRVKQAAQHSLTPAA